MSLGPVIWSLLAIVHENDILAASLFCLSLNYKQMSLYFAPAFLAYFLGRCGRSPSPLRHFVQLALSVVITFGICWLPLAVASSTKSSWDSIKAVLLRLFPVARGLYEDKVANVWCSLSLIFKLNRILSHTDQLKVCAITTFLGFLPSFTMLIARPPPSPKSLDVLLYALTITAFSFFLFSFQVHEKTVLLPILPLALLLPLRPHYVAFLSAMSIFSMYPLMKKDHLELPYFLLLFIFLMVCRRLMLSKLPGRTPSNVMKLYIVVSAVGATVIHVADVLLDPPARYPDLKTYTFTTYSCIHFIIAWILCTVWQAQASSRRVHSE